MSPGRIGTDAKPRGEEGHLEPMALGGVAVGGIGGIGGEAFGARRARGAGRNGSAIGQQHARAASTMSGQADCGRRGARLALRAGRGLLLLGRDGAAVSEEEAEEAEEERRRRGEGEERER